LTKILAVALGSSLPAYLAWSLTEPHSIMIRFWVTLGAWALGWYLSRRFVRNHLDF
jgi:hypothetical protein